jgi:uncharacterized protein YqiB (DUF1249 family)
MKIERTRKRQTFKQERESNMKKLRKKRKQENQLLGNWLPQCLQQREKKAEIFCCGFA